MCWLRQRMSRGAPPGTAGCRTPLRPLPEGRVINRLSFEAAAEINLFILTISKFKNYFASNNKVYTNLHIYYKYIGILNIFIIIPSLRNTYIDCSNLNIGMLL